MQRTTVTATAAAIAAAPAILAMSAMAMSAMAIATGWEGSLSFRVGGDQGVEIRLEHTSPK